VSRPDVLELLEAAAAAQRRELEEESEEPAEALGTSTQVTAAVQRLLEEALQPQELEIELEEPPAQPEPPATRPELVKVYLLAMRLPSRYLLQTVEFITDADGVEEVRRWEGEAARLAARLETVRKRAYAMASRVFANVEEYGTWIAVSEAALAEAERISKYVRKELAKLGLAQYVDRYRVRAVPVYLEPEEAEELLCAAIEHLSEDVEELQQRIKEAWKARDSQTEQRLRRDKRYREALLASFKKYVASVLGKRWEQ